MLPSELSSYSGQLIRARALSGFAELVQRHGGDAAALCRAAGIAPGLLDTPDAALPLNRLLALLDTAAGQLGLQDFGLQLAQLQDLQVLGPVALIARHAATVGAACTAIARHLPYHSPGLRLHVEDDPDRHGYAQLRFELAAGEGMPRRQMLELLAAIAQRFLRRTTDDGGSDWRVLFRHPGMTDAPCYRACFSGPVQFGQGRDSLSFPARLLLTPLAPDRSALQHAVERWVGNAVRRYPLDLCRQVEVRIVRQLAGGDASLIQVACQLGLHERTLQRRLKEQGLYFGDMVDRVRRRLAVEYLSHRAIPLAEVSAILGYSEQSSLNRACRRWFNASPQAYRARSSRA